MENETKKQTVTLTDRKCLTVGAVTDVLHFDEETVNLQTDLGRLTVEGSGLRIENLSKESKNILITGEISGLFYSDAPDGKKKTFGRWFG